MKRIKAKKYNRVIQQIGVSVVVASRLRFLDEFTSEKATEYLKSQMRSLVRKHGIGVTVHTWLDFKQRVVQKGVIDIRIGDGTQTVPIFVNGITEVLESYV